EMAVAYSFGFGATALRLGGWIKASAAVRPGTEEAAVRGIRDVISGVLDGGREARELLARGAAHLAGTEEMAFQKKGAVAHWMCANDGTPLGYDSFRTLADRIRRIEPDEVLAAVRARLLAEPLIVVLRPADG
ncbi:MAG: hypothetical protein FJ087_19420, partial [Deltaproteobacteria bacterium]|nr:hypothetical protein [Deltaproteobacteria bacterium]